MNSPDGFRAVLTSTAPSQDREGDVPGGGEGIFGFGNDYEILDAGEATVPVPLLACACPDIDGATVSSTVTNTLTGSSEATFKIFGSGIDATAKLTLESANQLSCARNESSVLVVQVPVLWQQRKSKSTGEVTVAFEPDRSSTSESLTLVVQSGPGPSVTTSNEVVDLREASGSTLTPTRTMSVDGSAAIVAGFSIKAIGIEASLTLTAEFEQEISATTDLPGGHQYELNWLARPPGLQVTLATD
jgi:hypothetical protein